MRNYKYLGLGNEPLRKQYYIYLVFHGKGRKAKDYSSRVNTIVDHFQGIEFITNKVYEKIHGSRNFISFDGRFVINKNNIVDVTEDIYHYYNTLNSKEINSIFKLRNVEHVAKEIAAYLTFILDKNLYSVCKEENIKEYYNQLSGNRKEIFIDSLRIYSLIKGLDISNEKLDEIVQSHKEEMEKLKFIEESMKENPSLIPHVKSILNNL